MNPPEAAVELLQRDPDVVAIYFFGSRAIDRHREDSDWDIAVLWAAEVPSAERFRRRLQLMERLSHLLRARVDVVDVRAAPVLLVAQAIRGTLIVDRDPLVRCTFEMRIRGQEDDERIARRWARAATRRGRTSPRR